MSRERDGASRPGRASPAAGPERRRPGRFDPRRMWAMSRKEMIQLRRDRRSLIMAFFLPMALVLFFGYAITWDVRDIRLAVLDRDHTLQSRALVQAMESSGYFDVRGRLARDAEADEWLASGRALAVLAIPPGFARDLASRARAAPVQLLLDGSDANTATIALGYADAIVARFSADAVLEGRNAEPPVRAESRVWYNETLESRNMVVPGLVAVIMAIIAAMLTALTIAREWERGTMEQLAATPVHRLEVVVGKLLPYLAIGFLDVALAVLAGVAVFGVPFRGSALLLIPYTLLFLAGALGVGMFISAATRSQVLATQYAILATYLPSLLLSGFLFAIDNMPVALRAITYLVPARYYVTVTKGIFLKGIGAPELWVQGVSLLLFASLGLGLASRAFRKEIA